MNNTFNTIEDFLLDDNFIKWTIQPTTELNQYWEDYIQKHPHKNDELVQAKSFLLKLVNNNNTHFDQEINNDSIERIWNNILATKHTPKVRSLPFIIRRIAASIIFIIGIAAALYFVYDLNNKPMEISGTQIPLAANPDKIQLILGDGSILNLIDEKGKEIVNASEVTAKMIDDATLKYDKKTELITEVNYNTAIVPRGRKLRIVLSDGSKVWLNAESKLKYPTVFNGDTRTVELIKGEAIFEITKNTNNPFIVDVENLAVRVLGTTFNISTYEENTIETVLVEGSINMYRKSLPYTKETALQVEPNQKASYYKSGDNIMLENVKSIDYTSWKDGVLYFKNESFKSLVKKIERWYDVDINLTSEELNDLHFTGVIREGKTIDHILTLIKSTNPIDYSIDEKIVTLSIRN